MKNYFLSSLFLILIPSFMHAQIAVTRQQPFQLSIIENAVLSNSHAPESNISMIIPPLTKTVADPGTKKTSRKGGFGRGAWIGAAAGGAAGGIIGIATYKPCNGLGCILTPNSRGDSFVVGLVAGSVCGALIGGITGVIIKKSRKK